MVFVINNLKYDTDKMERISTKCQYQWKSKLGNYYLPARDVNLFKSSRGRWLLTYKANYSVWAKVLTEDEAKNMLIHFDIDTYEKIFGELEEA